MKKRRLIQLQDQIIQKLGGSQGKKVAVAMEHEYHILCNTFANPPQDLIPHLHNNIFPVVATFRALLKENIPRNTSAKLVEDAFLELMEKPAIIIRKLCNIPGFYRLVPLLFKWLMPNLFKENAGFTFKSYPTNMRQAKFDMLSCPYYKTCQELDCLELAPIFCASDDICYGNMHPKLCWKRTQTLARGGNYCDFDLEVNPAKKKCK